MYRDGQTAEIETLRNDIARSDAARVALLAQQDALRKELHRIKEGVAPDPALGAHAPYRRMQAVLLVLAVVASVLLTFGLKYVLAWAVADPLFTMQGLRNFGWSVVHGRGIIGIAATGFVLLVTMPWVLLPVLGRRGLKGEHRWGWLSAVAGAALFLPTPLMPLAVFALSVLFSKRVRAVYFPG